VFDEPDEVLARIDDDVRRVQQRAAILATLQQTVDGIRGTARSDQHDVTVEVDSSGRVTDLRIEDQAFQRGGRQLSGEILALIRAALRSAREQALAATAELVGEDDPMIGVIRAEDEAAAANSHGWLLGGGRA
jgi:DNA-binding protein YbaB